MRQSPSVTLSGLLGWFLIFLLVIVPAFGQATWVASQRTDNEVRFLIGSQIMRYDLTTKSWLPARDLPRSGATAIAGDGQGTAVAYGTAIYRYGTDFSQETLVANTTSSIQSLFFDGNLLIAIHSQGTTGKITIFDRTSGTQLSTVSTNNSPIFAASHAPNTNRIYGLASVVGPTSNMTASYTDAGVVSNPATGAPYSGTTIRTKTWSFPEEARVADTSGAVLSTPAMGAFSSFSGSITDLAFNGDVPVVLRGGELIAFTSNLQEAGRGAVGATTGANLFLTTSDAFVFSPAVGNPAVNVIPLTSLNAPAPGTPIDPSGLPYAIDRAFQDGDGNILIFSKAQMSLFRWSPAARQYRGSIPLDGVPMLATYSKENHSAYFAYDTKVVQKMDLSPVQPDETAFTTLPGTPNALEAAGDMVFTADLSVTSGVHSVFSQAGVKSSTRSGSYSQTWRWDPAKRRMYYFRSNLSPDDLAYTTIDALGQLSVAKESPYHADFAVTVPIRVSSDGSRVVIGSGVVFETDGLTKAAFLSNSFSDAVWSGGKLVTIRSFNGGTQLQTWEGSQFLPGAAVRQFSGTPVRLFDTPQGLVVITSVENAPRFTLFDSALNTVFASPARPMAPSVLAVNARTANSITLQWQDKSDSEDGFRIEYRSGLGTWLAGPTVGTGITSALVTNLAPGTTYEFRVAATNGPLTSGSTSVVTATTLVSPRMPAGEPYNLQVSRLFHDRIVLEWQDNATNETAFNIYRSVLPDDLGTLLTAPANSVSFTDTGLAANTLYYYRIQAVNGEVAGDLSTQINRRTLTGARAPSAPSGLTATSLGSQSVILAWSDTSVNEDEFIIERSGFPVGVWTELGRVGFNAKTFTDGTVIPDVTYSYRVKSSNETGFSTSSVTTVKPPKVGGEFSGYSIRSGDVYYFAFKGPDRIERYDLQSRLWLAPIPLQTAATAIWVDETGIFVAEGRSIVRIGLDGSNRTPLVNSENPVKSLITIGGILAFQPSTAFFTSDKQTGAPLATFENVSPSGPIGSGFSVSLSQRKAYYRPADQNSGKIYSVEIGADGKMISGKAGSYGSDYHPGGERAFLFPDGNRVVDDSGKTYNSATLTYSGNLGGPFTDLSFHGATVPIVLRDNRLLSYSNNLLETGSFSLDAKGLRVAVTGTDAVVFSVDAVAVNGLRVQAIPLSNIIPQVAGPAVNPRGLVFTPDDVLLDKNGSLLLFSKTHKSLFRWSPSQFGYLPTLPLVGEPAFVGYSAENHHAYFAYDNQVVRDMDLAAANPMEVPLFNLPAKPRGLTLAGEFPYVADGARLMTFSKTGTMITSDYPGSHGNQNAWDPANRRVYNFLNGNSLKFDTISPTGVITGSAQTPYDGQFSAFNPIRVRPDGSKVVIGSGIVYNASDLTKAASLANRFTDATWFGGQLVTARLNNGVTQIQTWIEPQYLAGTTTREVPGTPLRLLALDSTRLVLISLIAGEPQFTILNTQLQPVFVSPIRPTPPSTLTVTNRTDSSVSLSWEDRSGDEDGFRVEYRSLGGEWTAGASTDANATSANISGLPVGTTLEFRVAATLAELTSIPSPTVSTSTLSHPNQPIGEPYGLKITRIFDKSITLEWQDNSNNETGFRIFQSTTASGIAVELNVPAGTTSFNSTGLTAATSYFFRVQAMNGLLAGDLSGQVSATTTAANLTPSAPSNLSHSLLTETSVTLTWVDNSTNEESFDIERADSPLTTWAKVGSVPFNAISFTDTTLSPQKSYAFRVRAVNENGSAVSNTIYPSLPRVGGNFTGRSMQSGGIYYFVFNTPNRIERYNLASRTWLAPVVLENEATALWVDESGIFVAEDRAISRFALDGSGKTALANSETTVGTLYTLNQLLGYVSSGNLINVNKQTGAFVSTLSDRIHSLYGFGYSVIPSLNRALFLLNGPSICYVDIGASGNLIRAAKSPHNGDFANKPRTFLFPDQTRVADNSGTVYSTADLTYRNSFGAQFTDMSFRGTNGAILLRNDKLHLCDNALLETGSFSLGSTGIRVAVAGEDALVFFEDFRNGRGLRVQAVPFSSIVPAAPEPVPDPRGLVYTVDDSFVDKDGVLLLFSKGWRSLFRWSPVLKDYLPAIPLSDYPNYAVYHKESHRIFVACGDKVVRKIELSDAAPVATPFVNLPTSPLGFALAGEFLLVPTASTRTIYSPTGQMTSYQSPSYSDLPHFSWDANRSRLYNFELGSSSDGLTFTNIDSTGKPTGNGQVSNDTSLLGLKPILVSPDGTKVAVGSGPVFQADGLKDPVYLANDFADGVWFGGNLVTIRPQAGQIQLQVWKGNQFVQEEVTRQFPGTPVRLHAVDSTRLVLISMVSGEPRFTLLNEEFAPTYVSPANVPPVRPAAPSALVVTGRGTNTVGLRWQDNSSSEDQFVVEYRTASGAWTEGVFSPADSTEASVSGLSAGTLYEFRVFSKNGSLISFPSSTISTLTLATSNQPVGEPYSLKVIRVFRQSITIGWLDNAVNETGFRIFQSSTSGGPATEVMLPAGSTEYTSSNLVAASTYFFRVQAVNGTVSGDLSAQVGATTRSSDAVSAAPTQFVVAEAAATSVKLSWLDNSRNEETFRVERSTNPATTWTEIGNLPYNTTAFTDSSALPNSIYLYRVSAVNPSGVSAYAQTSARTPGIGGVFTGHSMRSGNTYYFAFSGPNRVERYDLASRSWLTPIPLNVSATALWADESYLFVAEDRTVVRFSPDGGNRTLIVNASGTIRVMFTVNDVFGFRDPRGSLTTLAKHSGSILSTFSETQFANGFAAAPTLNRVFHLQGASNVAFFEIGPNGSLLNQAKNGQTRSFPSGSSLFVFPNGGRVADTLGNVYSTDSVSSTNVLGAAFTDLAFYGIDIPIVLRGDKLVAYDNRLMETGSVTLPASGLRVAVSAADAVVFTLDGFATRGLRVDLVPLSNLSAAQPGANIDPRGLAFTPDDVFLDRDGNLLLFSQSHLCIFRWSTQSRRFLPTLPLVGSPRFAAFSKEKHRAYFSYQSGVVSEMDLSSTAPAEVPLFTLPQSPLALAVNDEFITTTHLSPTISGQGVLSIYTSAGVETQTKAVPGVQSLWEWEPIKRRMYFLKNPQYFGGNLLFENIDVQGRFSGNGQSAESVVSTVGLRLRANPSGTHVVVGSGAVIETAGMTRAATLPNPFTDALWRSNELLTIRLVGDQTEIQRWDATDFTRIPSTNLFQGTPLRLIALDPLRSVLVTMADGKPIFKILNADLSHPAYDAWAASKNLTDSDAAFDADPDKDGLVNGLEFVLGGESNLANPESNSAALLPTISQHSGNLTFTFKRKDISESSVELKFQWSTDLAFQSLANEAPVGATDSTTNSIEVDVAENTPDADTDLITITIPATMAADGKLFGRLHAVKVP